MSKKRKLAKTARKKRFESKSQKLNVFGFLYNEKENTERLLQEAWLNLGDTNKLEIKNELVFPYRNTDYSDNPLMEFLAYMKNPDHFAFTCKYLFNVDILPFQQVILKELWNHKFPMLMASRGASKSFCLAIYAMLRGIFHQGAKIVLAGGAFRQAKIVFEYMEQIWQDAPILQSMYSRSATGIVGPRHSSDRYSFKLGASEVLAIPLGDGCLGNLTMITQDRGFRQLDDSTIQQCWGNGKFRNTGAFLNNGLKPIKKVRTKKGFEFEGTYNHKMKICRDQTIQWVRADEMVIGDKILIDRTPRWHGGNFQCTDEQAYTLGIMIGDGCWSSQYQLRYATVDKDHFISYLNTISIKKWTQMDDQHWQLCGKQLIDDWISFWRLKPECRTIEKVLPSTILSATQERMTACIQGLFDTDGTLQISTKKGGTSICVSFCNTSEQLVKQIQYILLHYGIVSCLTSRQRKENNSWNRVYELLITGQNAVKFGQQIGFRLKRKQDILLAGIQSKLRTTMVDDTIPDVRSEMIRVAKTYKFNYSDPSIALSKIQSRKEITFEYAQKFLNKYQDVDDIFIYQLRELLNSNIFYDEIISIEDGETYTCDIEIPDGHEYCANGFFSHNSKIRGLRANYCIVDEFSSLSKEIFEVVIRGFGAVSRRPDERVKQFAQIKKMKELGYTDIAQKMEDDIGFGNQVIISGTPDYVFNHFYEYWKKYKAFIECAGDYVKLREMLSTEVPDNFNWRDYCIIRLPYNMLPPGFLDETQIAQGGATMTREIFIKEYLACFPRDSSGFFKRSLIESCVCKPTITVGSTDVSFHARIDGDKSLKYVMGVDPASETDNFAIVILELSENPLYRKIVYSWTMNRVKLREKMKRMSKSTDINFYSYCARKIRDLSYRFPTDHIGIDSQGGGISIFEALHDVTQLKTGEQKYWPYIRQGDNDVFWWEKPDKPTDGEQGVHNIHTINFVNAEFVREANHGLRFDFENRLILFPCYDALTAVTENLEDDIDGDGDTLEDCYLELEEMKNELASVVHTQTVTGRDKWDTPEIKLQGNKKGRLRKDRYSALLIANEVARVMTKEQIGQVHYHTVGGFAGQNIERRENNGNKQLYIGPAHITGQMTGIYGMGVSRYR